MSDESEEWRLSSIIDGYLVSDHGNIRRSVAVYSGRKHAINGIARHYGKDGVATVSVVINGIQSSVPVNRVVYNAFRSHITRALWIKHLDGDKTNCRPDNLQAYTPIKDRDLTGHIFGRWTVLEFGDIVDGKNRRWLCKCECGAVKKIGAQHLRSGQSTSCGCKRKETNSARMSGSNHPGWKGGIRNVGSEAWCGNRLDNLRQGIKGRPSASIASTPKDVSRLWIAANGKCSACGKPFPSPKHTHLDHDHETGRVRGFLCAYCNVAIGMAGDSPDTLRKLAKYLDEHNSINDIDPRLILEGL